MDHHSEYEGGDLQQKIERKGLEIVDDKLNLICQQSKHKYKYTIIYEDIS